MRSHAKWLLLLLLTVVLSYWKIVFTRQFSFLVGYEGANQSYSWFQFTASTIQQGILPLWDSYAHAGRSFVGEMQTGLFYPLKLPLYLWPSGPSGASSLQLLHLFFVLAHVLASFFLFFLARDLGLRPFPAFVAGLCFSLGGFVGRVDWPDMMDSAIWLPLVVLFLNRALGAARTARGLLYACLSGVGLGMAILGGRLHVAMMDVVVIVSFAVYHAFQAGQASAGPSPRRRAWLWSAAVVGVVGVVAFAVGAAQLLPSMEYSKLALRYLGGDAPGYPARQRIPYADMSDGFLPRSLFAFLLGFPFGGGQVGSSEVFSPYFGVLPLLLASIGVRQNWDKSWVKFLTGLAILAFFYSMGFLSILHGLFYALVPYLWMSRIAARFIYLTHFAMALLAGFGLQTLFAEEAPGRAWLAGLARAGRWIVIGLALFLGIPALYGKPEINEWHYFSFLVILGSYGLFVYVIRGHRTRATQFVFVALILFDLLAFQWALRNRMDVQKTGTDHLEMLLGLRNVANFLRAQPGLFRVEINVQPEPNVGDFYGVQTIGGMSATILTDYDQFLKTVPRANDLLNVLYVVRAKPQAPAQPVYSDGKYLVYENPSYCPRAWVVHQTVVDHSPDGVLHRIAQPDFDPRRAAVVREPLEAALQPAGPDSPDEVRFEHYQADRLELRVRAGSHGLLVLSEVYYPGWRATVNEAPARIHQVNGLLRGVVVPAGESRVSFRYAPRSILAGALLSCFAFSATLLFALVLWVKGRRAQKAVAPAGESR